MQRIIFSSRQAIVLTFLTAMVFSSSATMYKWVDEDGTVMYTESKPSGTTEYEVIQPPAEVDSARALKDLRDTRNQANQLRGERLKKQQEEERLAQEKARVEQNCDIAKNKLASLQQPRAKISQPDGSRIRLDEEERQQQLVQAQAKIQEWCD